MNTIDQRTGNPPLPRKWLARLRLWQFRRHTRHALADLDADRLNDIGLTPDEAQREASKWMWRG